MRTTALSTFGGGENAPAGTPNSISARATAATFTVSAPYSLPPGRATESLRHFAAAPGTRRASARGGARAWKRMGVVM